MSHPNADSAAESWPARAAAVPFWVGQGDSALCAWLHRGRGAVRGAVLICPPMGYELWTSYQTLRELAERLAGLGFDVLRFDYSGTGDSAGEMLAPGRVTQWRENVCAAAAELRRLSKATELVLLGLRFGAALAVEQAHRLGARALVLWDPVVSGRRYVRELKMLATKEEASTESEEILEVAGCLYSAETVQSLSAIDLLKLPAEDASGVPVLLVDRDDRPANTALADRLRDQGAAVTQQAVAGMSAMMDVSTEDAQVPTEILGCITAWLAATCCTSARDAMAGDPPLQQQVELTCDAAAIHEEMVQVGDVPLFGVLGGPASAPTHKLVILLSSGTEHRIGPGRAWVSLARSLNAAGIAALRVDLNGIGDSPMRGAPRQVRPYDPSFFDDVAEFIAFARQRGYAHVSVLGLCSGAWMAVQAGVQLDVNAVVAINPQLYWQQGDPVESLIQDTRIRRRDEVLREQEGCHSGLWTQQDEMGLRTPAGVWLDTLVSKQVRSLLAFADNDDGLQHLRVRCGRRFEQVLASGVVSVIEVPGLDHPMHRYRRRPDMFAAITRFLAAC